MIKIPQGQLIPRFYLPVKYSMNSRSIECYLFFIAPFAVLYEKVINSFVYIWCCFIDDSSQNLCDNIMYDIESTGYINKKTHKLEIDTFELEMLEKRIRARLKGRGQNEFI